MAHYLVILESPGKIGAVKNYLGANYKVIASIGHVRDLPKSSLGIDIDSFIPHYINIRGKGDVIKELKKEAKVADKIFFATDPDREGEAISWHLSCVLGEESKKAKRVTFNEITQNAVKEGIKHPRDINMNLVNAQQARRILDRIVGYQISPFLWKTVKSGLSAGRVQSVATKIIVEREEEIKAFVPKEYWTIGAVLQTKDGKSVLANFYGKDGKRVKLTSKTQTNEVLSAIDGKPFTVKEVKRTVKERAPQPPFTTSTMQQDASRKFNFQSQKTMKIAQELYEGINVGAENGGVQGLITYMRTDSLRISKDAQEEAKKYIVSKYGETFYPSLPKIYKTKAGAQDAHEAIRPSHIALDPQILKKYLTADQYKLYKLIWDRFMASQMQNAQIETVIADIDNSGYTFRAGGYLVKFQGYMAIYEETSALQRATEEDAFDPEKNSKIPNVTEKETLSLTEISPKQQFTEPPLRYDEANLIKFLEEKGIGRPSTYTPIITVILGRGYVEREGRYLKPTSLGEVTTKLMNEHFPDIVNYQFTANMENSLDTIENGETSTESVLRDFYDDFQKELTEADKKLAKAEIELPVEETDIICELCGAKMVVKNGRFGKFAACPNYPTCKNTKTLDKDGKVKEAEKGEKTDLKCELCGSDMVLRHGRYGDFYACSNYPSCKFTKQKDVLEGISCPKCGGKLILKYTKSRKPFYSCENFPKCRFSTWDIPTKETCPQCHFMMIEKRNSNLLVCGNDACGYSVEKNDK